MIFLIIISILSINTDTPKPVQGRAYHHELFIRENYLK